MGTNFFLRVNACPTCGRTSEEYHIGKSSIGWCFSLCTYPELGIHSLNSWKFHFHNPDNRIFDEYHQELTSEEMLNRITNRRHDGPDKDKYPKNIYSSYEEFLKANHAEPGPNGLLRHKIDGTHCMGHGEGTWDYMKGWFR